MRSIGKNMHGARGAWLAAALLACAGCSPMSEHVRDPSAGMNGGFEHARDGLPVNWLVYSPATIPSGRYELLFDRTDFKQGSQSLRFLVEECSATGGWHSPGIAQEVPIEPGAAYAIGFWIRNEGCDWTVSIGGVSAKTGDLSLTIGPSDEGEGAWQRVVREYKVPPEYDRLRFELSIRSPGSLWIDDVGIERVGAGKEQ